MTSVSLVTNGDTPLDEPYVQDSFYIFLQASLDQARAEGLLDVEVLSSTEGDLIIKGVSLPFVLLIVLNCTRARAVPLLGSTRCTTNSPSIALPHVGDAVRFAQRPTLSRTICPSIFVPLMNCWSECVRSYA